MTDYVRVRSLATGHESTIPEARFDYERWERLTKPAVDRYGAPLPPKYRTAKDGAPAPRPAPVEQPATDLAWDVLADLDTTTDPVPAADVAPATGHLADTEGESDGPAR